MKTIKIDDETYEILYNVKLQVNKNIKDLIKEAILFYIQYKDKLQNTNEKITLDTECIFGYYTIRDGAKDYECPILAKKIVINPNDILKYCKLCNRRMLVLKLKTKERKIPVYAKPVVNDVDIMKRYVDIEYISEAGLHKFTCRICKEDYYSRSEILKHIKNEHMDEIY